MVGAYFANDELDKRLREEFGETAVKPALLFYGCRLNTERLECDYMTADRKVPEGEVEVVLATKTGGPKKTIRILFDMTATSGLYQNGVFERVTDEH